MTQTMSQGKAKKMRYFNLPAIAEHVGNPVNLVQAHEVPRKGRYAIPIPGEYILRADFRASKKGPFDLWELRDTFLSWPINDWEGFISLAGQPLPLTRHHKYRESDLAEWQKLIREAMLVPAKEWKQLASKFDPNKVQVLFTPLAMSFDSQADVPRIVIRSKTSLQGIIASVHLDQSQGVQFKCCTRRDCGRPFAIKSQHERKYCSPQCAHLEAVRRSREAVRAKKTKARK